MSNHIGIDPAGLARLNKIGGPAFVRQMIDIFLEEVPGRMAAARTGEQTGDHAAVAEAAHSIKQSAHNFGATNLSLIAERIDMSVRAKNIANLSAMVNDLEQAYSAAKSWLEDQRKTLAT
jgi:HPt (histidine-containing phosphotransfer) domain-containing protein